MWKARKAIARQFKFVISRKAMLGRYLGWLAFPPEHWDPAGLSVRDGSQFILMLWNIKAKCTFSRSKNFSAAQGPPANSSDHNNTYYSITVHCIAARCKWFSIGFILYLLWAVDLYEYYQKTVCHVEKTACAVLSTPWNILMTLSVRGAGSSRRYPATGWSWRVWALTWTIHTSVAPQGAFMHIYSRQGRGHAALLAQH